MMKKFKPSVWEQMKLVSKPTTRDAAIRADDDGVMWRWLSAGKYVTAEKVTKFPWRNDLHRILSMPDEYFAPK